VILEVAILNVRAGQELAFEKAFHDTRRILAAADGYITHELKRCVEKPGQYVLLVTWQTLEDHTQGFRGSPAYAEWKKRLHRFYDPFPTVGHYADVSPP
jgi:heme-degrading monooxygenase HmoA